MVTVKLDGSNCCPTPVISTRSVSTDRRRSVDTALLVKLPLDSRMGTSTEVVKSPTTRSTSACTGYRCDTGTTTVNDCELLYARSTSVNAVSTIPVGDTERAAARSFKALHRCAVTLWQIWTAPWVEDTPPDGNSGPGGSSDGCSGCGKSFVDSSAACTEIA
jgi:hypothetical protein